MLEKNKNCRIEVQIVLIIMCSNGHGEFAPLMTAQQLSKYTNIGSTHIKKYSAFSIPIVNSTLYLVAKHIISNSECDATVREHC